MENETSKKSGASTIAVILIGIVHLVAFGWIVYSTDKMLYKIFFGVMGVLLFIVIVDKIRGNSEDDKDKEEPAKE